MRPLRRELVDMLDLEPGDQVLEVSVGTGANLPLMCEKIGPSGRISGVDISEGMLAQVRKKLPSIPCAVELRQGLAEDLPYQENSFDAVLHLGCYQLHDRPPPSPWRRWTEWRGPAPGLSSRMRRWPPLAASDRCCLWRSSGLCRGSGPRRSWFPTRIPSFTTWQGATSTPLRGGRHRPLPASP